MCQAYEDERNFVIYCENKQNKSLEEDQEQKTHIDKENLREIIEFAKKHIGW